METTTIVLALIFVVFGILQIILFFKIWGMTDNVRLMHQNIASIQNLLSERITNESNPHQKYPSPIQSHSAAKFKDGDVVLDKVSQKRLIVVEVQTDGMCLCGNVAGEIERVFTPDELSVIE